MIANYTLHRNLGIAKVVIRKTHLPTLPGHPPFPEASTIF
jgi:hypothetical protein